VALDIMLAATSDKPIRLTVKLGLLVALSGVFICHLHADQVISKVKILSQGYWQV